LFRSVEIAIIAMYVVSVAIIMSGVLIIHQVFGYDKWGIILAFAMFGSVFLGKMVAKIAINPLVEHFEQLDRFSKETLHELNLPINTITANTAMLRKCHSDEKSLKRLDRIELAASMLKERYNELDYMIKKQIEKEQIERFDIADLIHERKVFLQALYPNVSWHVDVKSMEVVLDRIGMAKVIDNLVDNGVKYSLKNPEISIRLYENNLSVCDKGQGMDELELMRIFERYYQNDATMAGYGIGLGLVKRYCDRHDIGLRVESKPAEGTCVHLDLTKLK